ncbi:hypothetical protein HY085_00905 [Candidatus Gottesmanbacteria bacterium]|nr:hypothetical protein [Candidatus Gottesmanbacteria bacterium]
MNKNLIYGLAAGGVVLILILVLFKNVGTPPAPVPVVVETATPVITETVVEKTDAGFSPDSVTIKKGTAVKFVNKSSAPMWVASTPHPIHTDYPGFDQKANGDIYTFTFDKVGSWKYHNHSPFSPGGMVVVTD